MRSLNPGPVTLLLVSCALAACASGSTPVQIPDAQRDSGVESTAVVPEAEIEDTEAARESDAIAQGNVLRPLDKVQMPADFENIRVVTRDKNLLHLFGCDVQGKRCRRIDVEPTGATQVVELSGIAQVQSETVVSRGSVMWGARSLSGRGNLWERVELDLRMQQIGSAKNLGAGGTSAVIPLVASAGVRLWVLWSKTQQTKVQYFYWNTPTATHQLDPPAGGWPQFLVPTLSCVASGKRLALLRGSEGGLEAILVDETGELRRNAVTTGLIESHALARVRDGYVAVWREPNGRRGLRRQEAGRVKLQRLDSNVKLVGTPQIIVESTPSVADTIFLWADDAGRLAVGRTDRWRGGVIPHHSSTPSNPVRQPGFQSASWVAAYDLENETIGEWQELGPAPILTGEWIGDTLNVVMQVDSTTDDPFDPSRLERSAPHVQRFQLNESVR